VRLVEAAATSQGLKPSATCTRAGPRSVPAGGTSCRGSRAGHCCPGLDPRPDQRTALPEALWGHRARRRRSALLGLAHALLPGRRFRAPRTFPSPKFSKRTNLARSPCPKRPMASRLRRLKGRIRADPLPLPERGRRTAARWLPVTGGRRRLGLLGCCRGQPSGSRGSRPRRRPPLPSVPQGRRHYRRRGRGSRPLPPLTSSSRLQRPLAVVRLARRRIVSRARVRATQLAAYRPPPGPHHGLRG